MIITLVTYLFLRSRPSAVSKRDRFLASFSSLQKATGCQVQNSIAQIPNTIRPEQPRRNSSLVGDEDSKIPGSTRGWKERDHGTACPKIVKSPYVSQAPATCKANDTPPEGSLHPEACRECSPWLPCPKFAVNVVTGCLASQPLTLGAAIACA